jgi:hypothetical protein
MDLSGEAWQNAIENVIAKLGLKSFPDDWREAQQYAIDHELKFDLNGNIIEKETAMNKYKVIMFDTLADRRIEMEIEAESVFDAISIAADEIDNPEETELVEAVPCS